MAFRDAICAAVLLEPGKNMGLRRCILAERPGRNRSVILGYLHAGGGNLSKELSEPVRRGWGLRDSHFQHSDQQPDRGCAARVGQHLLSALDHTEQGDCICAVSDRGKFSRTSFLTKLVFGPNGERRDPLICLNRALRKAHGMSVFPHVIAPVGRKSV